MKIHILDDWFNTIERLPCFAKLRDYQVTVWNDHVDDIATLATRLRDADCLVLFRERTAITKELLGELPNLQLISQRSVYPHIDITACTENDVLVCSNLHKGSPSYAASEHCWALIMATMRQIPQQMASLQKGQWQMGVGKSLRGRSIGLYGYGRIAKQVAQYASAFGMQILWWASEKGRARAQQDGQSLAASRADFFSRPDIISIHVRLTPQTQGIFTADDFACMRADTVFVNTSRAGLIEHGALLQALDNGRPGTAAIDVFEQEPITWANDALATHKRVIATPHIGFVTEDELEVQFSDIFDQIAAYAQGSPIHMINPQVWEKGKK